MKRREGVFFFLSENEYHLFLMSGPSGVFFYSKVLRFEVQCFFFFPRCTPRTLKKTRE